MMWWALLVGCATNASVEAGRPPAVMVVEPAEGWTVERPPRCEVRGGDGLIVGVIRWLKEGALVGEGPSPPPGSFVRGHELECAARVSSPGGTAGWVRSGPIVIGNAPPQVVGVAVTPSTPLWREPLSCAATGSDADGDPVSFTYAWSVDGGPRGAGPVASGPWEPGATAVCAATPSDGLGEGVTVSAGAEVLPLPQGGNLLVVVLDDVGVEQLGLWSVGGGTKAPTPTLDGLAAQGVRFSRAYGAPVCSPARASLLTGRMAHQTGIGTQVNWLEDAWDLREEETTLPEALAPAGYSSSAVGKWHLGARGAGGSRSALDAGGFGWFEGIDSNLLGAGEDGRPVDWFDWEKNTNGVYSRVAGYNTSHLVDVALRRAAEMPEPWLLYLAPAAAHGPYHEPPPELHTTSYGPSPSVSEMYRASLEAADTELGRLLAGLEPAVRARTTVVVVGDNGSADPVAAAPYSDASKSTVYEGGVRVPLIVQGPAVVGGRVVDELVMVTDLFPTLLDLGGVVPDPAIGATAVSLVPCLMDLQRPPLRTWVAAERFEPNGLQGPYVVRNQMVRDERYKLISTLEGHEELYDLGMAVDEGADLLNDFVPGVEALAARDRLRALRDTVFVLP